MKRTMILMTVWVLATSPSWAKQQLRTITWEEVGDALWGEYGRVIPAEGESPARLVIENPRNEIATIPILTIENPGIDDVRWALHGKIRHRDVKGKGYVEMLSHFPNGSRCYTRTLSAMGPMKWITGSSGWRALALPFFAKGTPKPTRLTVNVYLPSYGTVEFEPMMLWEYAEGENPLTPPGAWWSDSAAGWIGGIGGSLLGLAGALVGWLSARGKGRKFVLPLHTGILVIGGLSLIAGIVALLLGQTYGVWFPLLLLGGVSILVFAPAGFAARRRYAQLELRKMQAMDT